MVRKWILFLIVLLLVYSIPAFSAVKVDWGATFSGNNAPSNSGLEWATGFQMSGDWVFGENVTFYLRDKVVIDSLTQEWAGSLDRCYLRFESGFFRVNLGKQAVGWGIGWFFRPVDIITPLTPLQKDETRPGKELAALRWSTSPLTALDVIAGDKLYAARGEWRLGDTNIRVMGVSQNQPDTINTLGWDAQGGLGGFYTEGKYVWKRSAFENGQITALLGWRRTVWSGRQLFLEYLRNNSTGLYSGKNYGAAGMQISWDELTSFNITGVFNVDDGGILLNGMTDIQLTDNIGLRGMIGVLAGPDGTEFTMLAQGAKWNVMVQMMYYF